MSKLSEWASTFKPYDEVYCLERASDTTGLYMTKTRVGNGVPCYNWTSPIYHIWINDKQVFTCMNYRDAYEIYKKEKERFEND